MKRRTVLKSSILIPSVVSIISSCSVKENVKQKKKLRILILGGTSFLGPHQIAVAMERGHSITTFTRGKTKPTIHRELFDNVEMLIGDRENNLKAIETGEWDVVIDNSGRKVKWTADTAQLLKGRVGRYMYTSSTGVYYPYMDENIKEDKKLVTETPHDLEHEWESAEYDYGVMKTLSEAAVKDAFGEEQILVVRPTYMVGPGDKTNRFIHWPIRLAKGGEVLIPGKRDTPVQYIDVRDVALFMIKQAEAEASGAFNAVGPAERENMADFVRKAAQAFSVVHSYVFIDDLRFLEDEGMLYLVPWIPSEGGNYGSARVSNEKAVNAGLTCRDPAATIKDTHEWWYSDAMDPANREKYESNPKSPVNLEQEIIKKWKAR